MKVVLFCGGRGLRMREASETVPKPMVKVGRRPVLWHIMKYYAHYGHTDFVLCLGHKAEVIKDYFLNYTEALSNDFVLSGSDKSVALLQSDISEWTITFVDTGYSSSIGERLRRVREHVAGEDYFLANYGDVLTDAPLDAMIADTRAKGAAAGFLAVRPNYTFHTIDFATGGRVAGLRNVVASDIWVNGGYFTLRGDIFEHLNPGEELVVEAFGRLIERDALVGWQHEGFWAPMDTLKEQQELEAMVESGGGPWRVWANGDGSDRLPPPSDR